MIDSLVSAKHSDYDPIAGFYHRHWCGHFHTGLLAMLDRVLLADLPPAAHVLDVCCGTGTVAAELIRRGFSVTGVDASEEMLRFARQEVPQADFLAANAEDFRLPALFHGAICTFDSCSYFLDEDALVRVFSNIHAALRPGGRFVFDLSLEEAYKSEWQESCSVVNTEEAYFVRGTYDVAERLGKTMITTFRREGSWQRTDVEFLARCHAPEAILDALAKAGFAQSTWISSEDDENIERELGRRRACFIATKSSAQTRNLQ